jgi:hypothetical protein
MEIVPAVETSPPPPISYIQKCVRKIGKSFGEITFYSHEEVVGSMSKRPRICSESTIIFRI